jgi:hypothetical protein
MGSMGQWQLRGAGARLCAALALPLCTGCYHYHITADRVPPSTEMRSQTQVAYVWGLLQPNDIVPPNCPQKVPLADVTANTNLGYVLIGTVTLGTVVIHNIEWRCAKLPSAIPVQVLRVTPPGGKG